MIQQEYMDKIIKIRLAEATLKLLNKGYSGESFPKTTLTYDSFRFEPIYRSSYIAVTLCMSQLGSIGACPADWNKISAILEKVDSEVDSLPDLFPEADVRRLADLMERSKNLFRKQGQIAFMGADDISGEGRALILATDRPCGFGHVSSIPWFFLEPAVSNMLSLRDNTLRSEATTTLGPWDLSAMSGVLRIARLIDANETHAEELTKILGTLDELESAEALIQEMITGFAAVSFDIRRRAKAQYTVPARYTGHIPVPFDFSGGTPFDRTSGISISWNFSGPFPWSQKFAFTGASTGLTCRSLSSKLHDLFLSGGEGKMPDSVELARGHRDNPRRLVEDFMLLASARDIRLVHRAKGDGWPKRKMRRLIRNLAKGIMADVSSRIDSLPVAAVPPQVPLGIKTFPPEGLTKKTLKVIQKCFLTEFGNRINEFVVPGQDIRHNFRFGVDGRDYYGQVRFRRDGLYYNAPPDVYIALVPPGHSRLHHFSLSDVLYDSVAAIEDQTYLLPEDEKGAPRERLFWHSLTENQNGPARRELLRTVAYDVPTFCEALEDAARKAAAELKRGLEYSEAILRNDFPEELTEVYLDERRGG